jgi:hypothetical protein
MPLSSLGKSAFQDQLKVFVLAEDGNAPGAYDAAKTDRTRSDAERETDAIVLHNAVCAKLNQILINPTPELFTELSQDLVSALTYACTFLQPQKHNVYGIFASLNLLLRIMYVYETAGIATNYCSIIQCIENINQFLDSPNKISPALKANIVFDNEIERATVASLSKALDILLLRKHPSFAHELSLIDKRIKALSGLDERKKYVPPALNLTTHAALSRAIASDRGTGIPLTPPSSARRKAVKETKKRRRESIINLDDELDGYHRKSQITRTPDMTDVHSVAAPAAAAQPAQATPQQQTFSLVLPFSLFGGNGSGTTHLRRPGQQALQLTVTEQQATPGGIRHTGTFHTSAFS